MRTVICAAIIEDNKISEITSKIINSLKQDAYLE